MPPTNRSIAQRHHEFDESMDSSPFEWSRFPAIQEGFAQDANTTNNAGSIISTHNEEGQKVAVGYAIVNNPMVNWMVIVEQSHDEVWAPIDRLRNVILACVFGTMGAMMILTFPVAHYSSRPIRRLRDATKRSVSPQVVEDDSLGSQHDGPDDGHAEELARKEGWFGQLIHYRRNQKASRAERKEAERRR
jgi:osomolarity two-component system, sensor histidine kinase SLN1